VRLFEELFFRRPRILDVLHRMHLVNACSQTAECELEVLSRYAKGKKCALEIGTYQGVSAVRIAGSLDTDGMLYCVDPWPDQRSRPNPTHAICRRHVQRAGLSRRITLIRGYSVDVQSELPAHLDFAFLDGDHSRDGIEADWRIVRDRVRVGGIVSFHDVIPVAGAEWRLFESAKYFADVVTKDSRFSLRETMLSLAVIERISD
jgi:predicted O-methyltransferase YrrM